MTYKKRSITLIPRQVRELDEAPPEPENPPRPGAHWVGWIHLLDEEKEELEWYAVWQDYKRRGFYLRQDSTGRVHTAPGSYNDLLTHIEKLWRT